jgi:photosystem II stability/assembly factor-like uncharacterized protein
VLRENSGVRIAAAFVLLLACIARIDVARADAARADITRADVGRAAFGDLSWRLIGPFRGGRVLAVAGVPRQPQHFYFGAVNGGVWETQDAGRTWQPLFDDQPLGAIGAIAVAPSAADVLYVGTGEADMRSDIAQGDGMYKSTDAGKTWTHIGLADSQQIAKILIDPNDAKTVFVAALGHPYGPNNERGVFRSRDGGASWQRVLGNDDATGAIDLAYEPGNPRVVYASMWQTRRTPWNIYPPANGPASGLYKSSDGGDTWSAIRGNGFPEKVGRIGVAVAQSDPKRVYAIVDNQAIADDIGGLYRSDDAGAHWKRVSKDARVWQRGWYFGRIAVDPKNANRIYAMNTIVLRSDDGGEHFIALKGDSTGDDFHELWIDPDNADRQILGVDQGAIVTLNGGRTWSSWHNQPTAQIYHVSTDNRFPYRVYGAQQDSGAAALPSRTGDYDGISMREFREITAGGESDMIAPDPDDPDIVYGGRVDRLDLRTGQSQSIDPTLPTPDDLYRRTWTLPLVFSKSNPKRLYFGNQRLYRTIDGGQHWEPISPDLTRESPETPPSLDAVTAANNLGQGPRRGVIYAIGPSPLDADLLWIGTDDGLVWQTHDEGAHWNNVTPSALGAWSKIGIVEPSHFDKAMAYIAVDRHRIEDRKPYIYRTRDNGASWQLIVAGIRDGDFVNAVREDPKRKGLLYAATERGMYVSFDDGDHWQSLQANLPRTSVRDIDVHGDDLVIATHGRGFWIMDDMTALRQIDPDTAHARAPARLYAPATAIRTRIGAFTGTPMPKDEPLASNPPAGAIIDYVLEKPARKPVELAIYDGDNHLVRRYSSADKAPNIDPAKLAYAPEWVPRATRLATTPGMHRFVWPLRYAKPDALANSDADSEGVWALPGRYTLELSVDGKRMRQPLTVAPDPRVKLADDAYAQQFAFAREIQAAQLRVGEAQSEAKKLHESLAKERADVSADADLVAAIDAFDAVVVARSGIVDSGNPQNAWAFPPTNTTTLRFIGETLEKLAGAADNADAAPTPDARAGYAAAMPMLERSLSAWSDTKTTQLAALNVRLKAAGRKAVSVQEAAAKKANQD